MYITKAKNYQILQSQKSNLRSENMDKKGSLPRFDLKIKNLDNWKLKDIRRKKKMFVNVNFHIVKNKSILL